jgi:hypothetical protein
LWTEWYEDFFEKNPNEMRAMKKDADGNIVFDETGDELFDKWEHELSLGLQPDLEEGLSVQEKEKLKKERELSKLGKEAMEKAELFSENYGSLTDRQAMLREKVASIRPTGSFGTVPTVTTVSKRLGD